MTRLYWQTWPRIYASGYLYVPRDPAGRRPAILNPHGHWRGGARHPTVQARLAALARLGYVALAVDSVHRHDHAIGLSPITIMTWNNIRAIDYLLSREDVDPARIGVVGASGGGQQTMYLMALDDRIAAAAPVVLISAFREILSPTFSHCRCNHVPGIARVDEPEICAVFAPPPALFISDTGDWTRSFPERGFPEIRATWSLFGAADRVLLRHHEGGHDFTRAMREHVYAFFDRFLRAGPARDRIPESEVRPETPEALWLGDPAPEILDIAARSYRRRVGDRGGSGPAAHREALAAGTGREKLIAWLVREVAPAVHAEHRHP